MRSRFLRPIARTLGAAAVSAALLGSVAVLPADAGAHGVKYRPTSTSKTTTAHGV